MAKPSDHDHKEYVAKMTLFEVLGENDTCEGRGGTHQVGWFVNQETAAKAAKGKGVFDQPGHITSHVKEVVVVTPKRGLVEYYVLGEKISMEYEDPREIRKRALSKLTQAEREALGVIDA